jgi:transglutaminase-like putative cysteine protease
MRYAVSHETRYRYSAPVVLGIHMIRLMPVNLTRQHVLDRQLTIDPPPATLADFSDHFGNIVYRAAIETTHDHFAVTLAATIEVVPENPPPSSGPAWEELRSAMRLDGFASPPPVAEFVYSSPLARIETEATLYAAHSFPKGRPIVEALRELNARIHADFSYVPNRTNILTGVAEIFALGEGVCQDFAHIMIAGLRGLGLPARYVSGYIRTRPAESDTGHVGTDASHAWISAWCGAELGWIEFDPTNNLVVSDAHIVIGYGRDFSDVTPLRGVILGGGSHSLSVAVGVTELASAAEQFNKFNKGASSPGSEAR